MNRPPQASNRQVLFADHNDKEWMDRELRCGCPRSQCSTVYLEEEEEDAIFIECAACYATWKVAFTCDYTFNVSDDLYETLLNVIDPTKHPFVHPEDGPGRWEVVFVPDGRAAEFAIATGNDPKTLFDNRNPECDHGVEFDLQAAFELTSEEVRKRWPRHVGACQKGCGFNGVAYASYAHFIAGDW